MKHTGAHEGFSQEDSDSPVINPQVMKNLRALQAYQKPGEPDVLEDLIAFFLKEIPGRFVKLHEAYARRDTEELERVSHSIAGSSATIGATILANRSQALELQAQEGRLDDTEVMIGEIEYQFGRVKEYFEQEMQ